MALIEMFGGVGPGGVLPAGSSAQTLRHDGAGWLANAVLSNDGSTVTVTPAAAALGMKIAAATSAGTTPAAQIENNVASLVWLINSQVAGPTSGSSAALMNGSDPTAAGHRLGVVAFGTRVAGVNQISSQIGCFSKAAWASGDKAAYLALYTTPVGSASVAERVRIEANGDVLLQNSGSELATTAVGGFPQLPTINGIPTGSPSAGTGQAPVVLNRNGLHFHAYLSAAWRQMGNGSQTYRSATNGDNINPHDYLVVAAASGNPATITLPSCAVVGVRTIIIRVGAGTGHAVTFQRAGSDTIEDMSGASVTSVSSTATGKTWTLTSDGISKWWMSAQ